MAHGEPIAEKMQKRMLPRHKSPEELARWILERLGESDMDGQLPPGKKSRPGRDISMYLMSRVGCYTHTEIGKVFGVGYTAIAGIIKRVEEKLEREKQQKRLADKILQAII